MCAIYSPIWKHAKKDYGKKILNANIVKTFPKSKFNVFCVFYDAFLFQPLIKGNYLSNSWFVTCYCLKKASKVGKNSKFTRTKRYLQIGLQMAHNMCFMKTVCTSKISQISGFQNHLQKEFNLHISICESKFQKNSLLWRTLQYMRNVQSLQISTFLMIQGPIFLVRKFKQYIGCFQ